MTRHDRIKDAFTRVGDMWANYVVMLERSRNPTEDAEIYLGYFLADKSLTGARIADLSKWQPITISKGRFVDGVLDEEPEWYMVGGWLDSSMPIEGTTPDEAIAALWRKVFIDTEEEA